MDIFLLLAFSVLVSVLFVSNINTEINFLPKGNDDKQRKPEKRGKEEEERRKEGRGQESFLKKNITE